MDDPRTVKVFVTSEYPAAGKSSIACTIGYLLKERGFNVVMDGKPHFAVLRPIDDRPIVVAEMLTGETPNVK